MSGKSKLSLIVGVLLLTSCASVAEQGATPSALPAANSAASPTVEIGGASKCSPHDFMEQVRDDIPYDEVSLLHNDLMGVHYLNLWVVDPDLDSDAAGEAVAANNAQAAKLAARLTFLVVNDNLCMRVLFNQVNATVVDRRYHAWFIGGIGTSDIPSGDELTDEALGQLTQAFLPSPMLQTPVEHPGPAVPPSGSCTWEEARRKLLGYYAPAGPNIDFYFVIDQDGANVWAQWDGPDPQRSPEVFLSGLLVLQTELKCLTPPVDVLWMIYSNTDGVVSLVRTIDGEALRNSSPDDLPNHLQIIYPAPNP